ncbi:MAG: hypothetical protein JSW61_13370 [Candidatus Thorarchaeota archaeon]|nr:MAG: hypothetical protein JSW61_13370 [Candidatus Thorarchaeota archaeon]
MTQFKETLERLTHVGVLSLFYERNWKNVSELILLASGKRERVQSLIYQIVRSSVGGFVASLDSGKTFLSGIRLSNKMANQVYESLPSYCLEAGINIRVEDLREFRSFRSDLYQRIWQGRGVWDSDVSGMLSQISVQQSQA